MMSIPTTDADAEREVIFETSRRIGLFERYRVPYRIASGVPHDLITISRASGTGPRLVSLRAEPQVEEGFYDLGETMLYAALAGRSAVAAALQASGQAWQREWPIIDAAGQECAAVYRANDGSIFLPFDVDAPLEALLSEGYVSGGWASHLHQLMRAAYYRARPLMPPSVRQKARRQFRRYQDRVVFPRWPIETSFHRLEALLLGLVEDIAGEQLPWISPWPEPYAWTVVLTHDVEQSQGYDHIDAVRSLEESNGLRSAWYLIPERDYRVDDALLKALKEAGHEVCLHGLRHDGRDLSPGIFERRLVAMRDYAERWGVVGFRGPATLRDRGVLQQLGIEHDSSSSDIARYEPQPGGSCSWLPFFIGEVVELPITMVMDHTLFEVLSETTNALWREKAAALREYGGMALMLTHPDYLRDPRRLRVYGDFVSELASERTAWHALPREIADWWRKRSRTHLERSGGFWVLRGPGADEARLRLGAPDLPPTTRAGAAPLIRL